MTSKHCASLVLLTLAVATTLPSSAVAQTVEDAPTNCCTEIYWAGWELGRLRSLASNTTPADPQAEGQHMQRLATTLQAANESCCRFCEAWAEWPQIQNGIRATAEELLHSPESDAATTRRAFRDWVESRPGQLVEGLNRCDLENGMPCKWLDLVECARSYFQLGVALGHAMGSAPLSGAPSAAALTTSGSARLDTLASLEQARDLMTTLRADDGAPESSEPQLRCRYLWPAETGATPLLSEVLDAPDAYTTAQLTARAAEVHRLVLRLLIDGRPDLGIPPCPIGAAHRHEDCDMAEEHGHRLPATPAD